MESYRELRRAMATYGYTRLYDIYILLFKSYGELQRALGSYGVNIFIYHWYNNSQELRRATESYGYMGKQRWMTLIYIFYKKNPATSQQQQKSLKEIYKKN